MRAFPRACVKRERLARRLHLTLRLSEHRAEEGPILRPELPLADPVVELTESVQRGQELRPRLTPERRHHGLRVPICARHHAAVVQRERGILTCELLL